MCYYMYEIIYIYTRTSLQLIPIICLSPFIYRRDIISILCFISSSFFIDPTSGD